MNSKSDKIGAEPPRTAVLVVHGMGSQKPNATLRGVADALWTHNDALATEDKAMWLKPAGQTNLFDLSMLTTMPIQTKPAPRIFEFHEFYWAHLLSDTKPVAVLLWAFELMRKGPHSEHIIRWAWEAGAAILCLLVMSIAVLSVTLTLHVTGLTTPMWDSYLTGVLNIRGIVALTTLALSATAMVLFSGAPGFWVWLRVNVIVFLIAGAVAIVIMLWPLAPGAWLNALMCGQWLRLDHLWTPIHRWAVFGSIAIVIAYAILDGLFLTPYFGDVARYMRVSPANVEGREKIQDLGVETLRVLQASGRFDRIIVVAHSLGTVVAYDVLKAMFAASVRELAATKLGEGEAFKTVDRFRAVPAAGPDADAWREEWRAAVRALSRETARAASTGSDAKPHPIWLISDLVTMGSPLTHAIFLMCTGRTTQELENDFDRRQRERELPSCPPPRIEGRRMTYAAKGTDDVRLNHAALFGFVRWTNLFFRIPRKNDFIGGPVGTAKLFGEGIKDIPLVQLVAGASGLSHNWYWIANGVRNKAEHLIELQNAADLLDEGPP